MGVGISVAAAGGRSRSAEDPQQRQEQVDDVQEQRHGRVHRVVQRVGQFECSAPVVDDVAGEQQGRSVLHPGHVPDPLLEAQAKSKWSNSKCNASKIYKEG